MMVTVIGLGYVGLTLAVELAESGHIVNGIDKNIELSLLTVSTVAG